MIILGSASDYKIAQKTINVFEEMEINYDIRVASAHRTHERLKNIVQNEANDVEVIIAIAGLAAHLPGVIASYTTKPVIAVPVDVKLSGIDSLLSCTEMQLGTPVATMGIDRGDNAAWLACQIIACNCKETRDKLVQKRLSYDKIIQESEEDLISKISGKHYQKTIATDVENKKIEDNFDIKSDINVMIVSGNYSNIETVKKVIHTLDVLGIKSEYEIISATRSPETLEKFINKTNDIVDLYIAVSSLSTILAGAIASHTTKAVIGIPCSTSLSGVDSLLSMIQMPPGVPIATMGLDAGENAALFVGRIFALSNDNIKKNLELFMNTLHRNAYYD